MGAWIEISIPQSKQQQNMVAPLVGAWIEIENQSDKGLTDESLPSWERGLKLVYLVSIQPLTLVAPLVGAWIEINAVFGTDLDPTESLPSWERGLK